MTFRAVFVGLLGALFICSFDYLSQYAWPLGFSFTSHLPISVFGLLVVVMLAANPLLYRIRPRWRLQSAELAMILLMCLTACGVANWTNNFSKIIAMSIQRAQISPTGRRFNVLGYLRPYILPGEGQWESPTMQHFLSGMSQGGRYVGLGGIPWEGWEAPLSVWLPLIVLTGLVAIGLSLVIHRQWSTHERLRYPIAEFGSSLLMQDQGRVMGRIYHNRLFWVGLCVLLAIDLNNHLYPWLSKYLVSIPTQFNFSAIQQRFPGLRRANWPGFLTQPRIIPIAVAFSYFLASDVGLSLGTCTLMFEAATLILVPMGIEPGSRNYVLGGWDSWMRMGSFTGMMLVLLYTGRRYYATLARRAAGLRTADPAEPSAVWGLRLAAAAYVGACLVLMSMGMEWTLAILAMGLLIVIFVVVSRMSAEAGQFSIRAAWMPVGMLTGLLGAPVMGPQAFMMLTLFSIVMVNDTISTLMPYLVNGLKVCDDLGARPSKAGAGMLAVLLLGIAIAVPVFMWVNYNFGAGNNDFWAGLHMPRHFFDTSNRTVTRLRVAGQLDDFRQYGPLERLVHGQPNERFLVCAVLGLALVLGFSALRLRLHWWPLHPVMLLAWGSWSMALYGFSFLLGWVIKQVVTRLGGGKAYQQLKPMMIGIIAGDLLGQLVPLVVTTIRYLIWGVTGEM
jgi:hypothetical protein